MFLRAHEVAKRAGISKNTLLRWLRAGKVPEVARDRNGWRIFSDEDLARIIAYARKTVSPEEYAARHGPGRPRERDLVRVRPAGGEGEAA